MMKPDKTALQELEKKIADLENNLNESFRNLKLLLYVYAVIIGILISLWIFDL